VFAVIQVCSLSARNNERIPYLLVRVKTCNGTNGLDAALPENPLVTFRSLSTPDIIHIETVTAVVGRMPIEVNMDGRRNTWAIIDRSRSGARTQFVDDEDDEDE
jgi:hypothetical protein